MLYTPSTNKRSKRGLFGVVTSSGTSGPFMRRLSFPVQSGTKPSTMWRQIFLATKQNWAALGVNGAGNIPVNGLYPQSAWAIQAASYFGIMQAGLIVYGVQKMGLLVGCATPDAYYTMVQANRASLGLAPLPAPELVNQYLALASGTNNQTIDGWAVSLSGPSTVDPNSPSIQVAVTFDQTPLPAAPTNFQAFATGLACVTTQPTLFFEYYLGETTNVTAAVANGSSITYTVVANPYGNGIVGSLFTCAGFTPTGFNCSLALITAASGNNITVASNTPAGSASTLGTATFYPVYANLYTASINVSPTSATTSGAITLNFSFQDANGTQNGSITVNASTGNTQVAQPCPTFDFPNSMSCSTLYDSGYNVLGFSLNYLAVNMTSFPMTRNGVEVPGLWALTASDQYTDSYSAPDASQWSPILFSGPYLPTPAEVLAAWEAVWGDLADSGNIIFQLSYLDPNTGASGPALSATAGWAKGTLKGASLASWTGPIFGWSTPATDFTVTAPGNSSQTIAFVGSCGYGGDLTLSVNRVKYGNTYGGNWDTTLPAGVTYTFTPNPVTIPTGSTTPVTCDFEATAVAGAGEFYAQVGIHVTDGIATRTLKVVMQINGNVTGQPYPVGLGISPDQQTYASPNPGTGSVAYTISNTTLEDIDVTMTAVADDPTAELSFDNVSFTVPAATPYGPTAAPATSSSGNLIYNNVFGAPAGSLVGSVLAATGYSPNDYNMGWGLITANDASTITVLKGSTAPPMTVEGTIYATAPGYATCNLSITLPGTRSSVGDQIKVTAGAGTETTYAALTLE
jgi:hypothetical protein